MAPVGLTTDTNASNRIALINEHVTGPPAAAILERSGLLREVSNSTQSLRLLDNASGIGTLIFRLLQHAKESSFDRLVGADIDENYLSYLRERASSAGFSRVQALRLDQQDPRLDNESFHYIFNNFGVFFAPNDVAVLAETLRMLKHGGLAGFTSWAKISWWDEVFLPALARYLPDAPALPHPTMIFPSKGWTDAESARVKLETAGFVDVNAEVWSFTPEVSPEDFALACAHLVKAMTARCWDEAARARFEGSIEKAFRDYAYETFDGGRWTGTMSAVLTWGRKV